ncbi:putative nucleoredoxin 1 [Bienertia sinuspersici]
MIQIGNSFDVISLLNCHGFGIADKSGYLVRNNGEKVEVDEETYRGKYVLVCCFYVPVLREDTYSDCVQVPWEDSRRSDYICKYLDLGHGCFKCLLLDKKGLVLPFDPSSLKLYGIEAFPFTVGEELPSLEEKKVSISKLNKRVVGLYLCVEGNLIPTLHKVHKQCKSRRLEFEIVVVYLPFVDCVDPQVYQENIDRRLRRRKVSWLRFPFNNSVSRRFWRLTCCYPDDRLMIVGPNAEFVDLYGGDVMMSYGIDAYPFTREGLIQRKINKVRALTLDHLVYRSRDYVLRCDDRTAVPVRVEELKGRNVFLYFDSLDNIDINDVDHGELVSWYYAIKAKVPDFEVVFVCFNDEENDLLSIEEIEEKLCAMPWLICPYDPDHSAFLKNLIGVEHLSPSLDLEKMAGCVHFNC